MLKLTYFPLRARAEQIRMILAYGKIPYTNELVQFQDWPKAKGNKDLYPLGQLPTLKLPNGTIIGQSCVIARYVAKLANVYPTDPERAAVADMIQTLTMEMNDINPVMVWLTAGSDAYTEKFNKYFAELNARLDVIVRYLGSDSYFGGNTPCHADFSLFHILDNTVLAKGDALAGHAALVSFMERMRSIPELAQYLAERPQPPFVGKKGSFINNIV
jgi:prostaglandin-H2 D-isomerase / glutathione transferase